MNKLLVLLLLLLSNVIFSHTINPANNNLKVWKLEKENKIIEGSFSMMKNGNVYINGKQLILPERAKTQYSYKVTYDLNNPDLDFEYLLNQVGSTDGGGFKSEARDTLFIRALTKEAAATLRSISGIKTVTQIDNKEGESNIFTRNPNWNGDNFGPIYIPEAGKTVTLNLTKYVNV